MTIRVVIVAVIFAATVTGCDRRSPAGKQVIVLGFDGMDYGVARGLMAQGRMPNFSQLAATGGFSPLGTSVPPQSPVAWSSVITGLEPEGHGIFDFVHRHPGTLVPYLSTTRIEPPARSLKVGRWQLPLSSARVELLRDGQPFWDVLEAHNVRTNILRMPANFPPSGSATRELSGMGTPDLLGTYGTFSFFTSPGGREAGRTLSGGRLETVKVVDDIVRGQITGPDNPFRTQATPVSVPFAVYIDKRAGAAKLEVGGEELVLKTGEWSEWVPIEFPLTSFQGLRAIGRFYLRQVEPAFELYVSPLNLDPAAPAMPISTPASYASELARATGRFHTQGIAEETKALSERVFTRDEFLTQARAVGDENIRQYWHVLDRFRDGFLFYYFGNLDQVSHMLWRPRDPTHPAYDPAADAPYRHVIDDLYVQFDSLVGETLKRKSGQDVTLIVMSDHGFTSWRRSFHLNSWLRDRGYLRPVDPFLTAESDFGNIDWSATRAYGLGLNGLYLNLQGRERDGIVPPGERERLVEEIRQGLLATIDPATGRAAIARVHVPKVSAGGAAHGGRAPDLVVLYAAGTRGSNESALGGLPREIMTDNTGEWSGDHCMDPDAVPGILLSSRPLRQRAATLGEVPRAILAEFGIAGFPGPASRR